MSGLSAERLSAALDDPADAGEHTAFRLLTRKASEIEARDITWLWKPWLPAGMVGLLAGYGGSGKSTVALSIAAACSTAGTLPDGQHAPLRNTLILAAEDSPEHTIVPRLIALGADRDRIRVVDGVGRPGDEPGWVTLRNTVAQIEETVREHGIGLVIVDPVSSYIGDANGDKESDVRSGIMPIVKMAERTGCAVLLIRHVSKAGDGVRAASRILGSTAWHDIPRVAWMLADAPDEHQPGPGEDGLRDTKRVLGVVKSNLAAKPQARMCVQPVDGPLRWMPEASPVTIDECFTTGGERGARTRNAEEWLAERLAGGARPSSEIETAANDAGITKSTLRRAKATLNVTAYRDQMQWYWRLPPGHTSNVMEGAHVSTPDEEMSTLDKVSMPKDAHHERLGIFPGDQRKTRGEEVAPLPAPVDQREEDAQDAHIPEMSTFPSPDLGDMDLDQLAEVEDIVTELRQGGPPAMEQWRADVEANSHLSDDERSLALLALQLATQEAA